MDLLIMGSKEDEGDRGEGRDPRLKQDIENSQTWYPWPSLGRNRPPGHDWVCVHCMAHGEPPGKRGDEMGENMAGSQKTGLDPGWLLGCMTPYIYDVSVPQFPHPPKRGWRALTEAEGKSSRSARQLLTARRA